MKHIFCVQYSQHWRRVRLGIPTASSFSKVMMGKGTKGRQDYLCRLVMERVLDRSLDDDVDTKWMRHGTQYESEAVDAFQETEKIVTVAGGFIFSDDYRYGCSPDRILSDRPELVEIKCPAPWTHCRYHIYGPGDDYKAQVQGQLLVTGFKTAYFFSYFPGLPPFQLETERDEKYIEKLKTELENFCDELDQKTEYIIKLGLINKNLALDVLAKIMPEVCE
jgi:hypothetical protein